MNWQAVADAIGTATGRPFVIEQREVVGGGCINQSFRLRGGGQSYFVKCNGIDQWEMFIAETAALEELAAANEVRVPRPICHGSANKNAFLVLEYGSLTSMDSAAQATLGRKLARLHRHQAEQFGWHRDNVIGASHQPNEWIKEWPDFFCGQTTRVPI